MIRLARKGIPINKKAGVISEKTKAENGRRVEEIPVNPP
jgi:hypothetical protein